MPVESPASVVSNTAIQMFAGAMSGIQQQNLDDGPSAAEYQGTLRLSAVFSVSLPYVKLEPPLVRLL